MVLREMNTTSTFRIYRNGVQQAALEATFSADGWSIPLFLADFLPFTSQIVEHSRYLLLSWINGNLAEGSAKSAPRIGKWAQSSDTPETIELIPPPKRTVLKQEMKICHTSFLLKSTLLFSNESDGGNRVRRFTPIFCG